MLARLVRGDALIEGEVKDQPRRRWRRVERLGASRVIRTSVIRIRTGVASQEIEVDTAATGISVPASALTASLM